MSRPRGVRDITIHNGWLRKAIDLQRNFHLLSMVGFAAVLIATWEILFAYVDQESQEHPMV